MAGFLSQLLDIATLVFAVTSMLAVGLSYTFKQLVAPFQGLRSWLVPLVANFVAVPLLAWGVIRLLELPLSLGIGLMLVATAAGAPFLIRLAHIARAEVALAAGLLVLQIVASIIVMPIAIPLFAPEVRVSAMAIATPLFLSMLLPLGVGLLVDQWSEPLACRIQPVMTRVSSLALVVLVVATFALHVPTVMLALGTGAIIAAIILVLGAFAIGYALARPEKRKRDLLGLGTAQRGLAAATVVATQAFNDPNVIVMVVVTMVVSMLLLFPIAWALGRRASQHSEKLQIAFLEEARQREPWA